MLRCKVYCQSTTPEVKFFLVFTVLHFTMMWLFFSSFSALTRLVEWQEGHLARNKYCRENSCKFPFEDQPNLAQLKKIGKLSKTECVCCVFGCSISIESMTSGCLRCHCSMSRCVLQSEWSTSHHLQWAFVWHAVGQFLWTLLLYCIYRNVTTADSHNSPVFSSFHSV